jgi:hypothetical protein
LASFRAFDQAVDGESLTAGAVMVAVDFVDREFQATFGAVESEVSVEAFPFALLHFRLDSAPFIPGIDDISGMDDTLDGSYPSATGFGGNRGIWKSIQWVIVRSRSNVYRRWRRILRRRRGLLRSSKMMLRERSLRSKPSMKLEQQMI